MVHGIGSTNSAVMAAVMQNFQEAMNQDLAEQQQAQQQLNAQENDPLT